MALLLSIGSRGDNWISGPNVPAFVSGRQPEGALVALRRSDGGTRGRAGGRLRFDGDLDLAQTFSSGQAFRWIERGAHWYGLIADDLVRVRVVGGSGGRQLAFESALGRAGPGEVARYFRLEEPLPLILAELSRDPHVERAARAFPGLRLLAQDPWELLVSFIVSANSNIPKIAATLDRLAQRAGRRVSLGGVTRSFFPEPEALAALSEDQLRETSMGYRAPYVLEAARLVAEGFFDPEAVPTLPYAEARRRLLEVPGVGEKVADCILLFSGGHDRAFPVDVWVRRVMERIYFRGRRTPPRLLRAFAWENWGDRAGFAQQLLFHSARQGGV